MIKNRRYIIAGTAMLIFTGMLMFSIHKDKTEEYQEVAGDNYLDGNIAIAGRGFAEEEQEFSKEVIINQAEVILRGETVAYEGYMEGSENIWTRETIRVIECSRGNVKQGDIIKIEKAGGAVLMSDYISAYSDADRQSIRDYDFAQYTDEQLETEYISYTMDGDAIVKLGKISTFYLQTNGDAPYSRVGGKYGEVVEAEGTGITDYKACEESIPQENDAGNIKADEEIGDGTNNVPQITLTPYPTIPPEISISPSVTIIPEISITPQASITDIPNN